MGFRSILGVSGMVVALSAMPALASARAKDTPARIALGVDGIGQTRNLPALLAERLGYPPAQRLAKQGAGHPDTSRGA